MHRSHVKNVANLLFLICLSSFSFSGEFLPPINFLLPSNPMSVIAQDFNGDGRVDLAVASFSGNKVAVLLGNGDGTFQAAVSYATQKGPLGLAVGDLNGDGKLDLIAPNGFSNSVSVFLGKGDGTFASANNIPLPIDPYGIALADLNGDGILDAAITNEGLHNPKLLVMFGAGDGSFLTPVTYGTRGAYPK